MPRKKQPTSFRLSPRALALLERLKDHLGLTRVGVLEMAIRKLARDEDIEPEKGEK